LRRPPAGHHLDRLVTAARVTCLGLTLAPLLAAVHAAVSHFAVLLVVALGTLITGVALRGCVTTRRTPPGAAAGRGVQSATFEW